MLHIQQYLYISVMKYELSHCIGFRVRRLSRIIDSLYRKRIKEFGITENQLTILFSLYEMGEVEQGKVGEMLALERSSTSRNIKLMIKEGWIQRTNDYRPKIQLTPTGNELVKKLIPIWEAAMDELTAMLKPDGFELVSKLEERIT